MSRLISYATAFDSFTTEIKPLVIAQYGSDDAVAMSEEWNNYTDSLCKDGQMNGLMYHYCPADDDDMPDDSDMSEFMLEAMGFIMSATVKTDHVNLSEWDKTATHYTVTIQRYAHTFTTTYSMGPSCVGGPELHDVMNDVLRDTDAASDRTFEEYCDDLGLDEDSRKALATYELCQQMAVDIAPLFSKSERADLQELMSEFD